MIDLTEKEISELELNQWLQGELEDLTNRFGVMRISLQSALVNNNSTDSVLDIYDKAELLSQTWDSIARIEKQLRDNS